MTTTRIINGEGWLGPGTPLTSNQLSFITQLYEEGNGDWVEQWPGLAEQYRSQVKSPPPSATRKINQTQQSPSSTVSNGVASPTIPRISVDDDGATPTQRRLTQLFVGGGEPIQPESNILDQYYSYTYVISIYLLSANDYANIISTKNVNLRGSQLLIQTGGAPTTATFSAVNTSGTPSPGVDGAGRNQFFPLDYYLDNVSIQSVMPGKGSRSATSNVQLNFTITEPNGITLLDNLYRAVDAMVGGRSDPKRKQNYASQHYLMAIRWYGYDEDGKLVPASNTRRTDTVTDRAAVAEKFIPFIFTNITFKIANQLVEYRCDAVVPHNYAATGQGRGVIPYNIELSATTLGKAFSGSANINGVTDTNIVGRVATAVANAIAPSAPPNANAANGPGVVTSGLVDALNLYQQQLVDEGIYEIADQYQVVFTDRVLSDAATVPPGQTNKSQVSNQAPKTAVSAIFGAKQSAPVDSKKISAVAGTTLIQFIDQVIRGSSYIYDQQVKIIDPDTGEEHLVGNPNQRRVVAWYRIGTEAVPLGYDRKRNDHAYRITYQISPYLVNDLQSNYFPEGLFRGYHKAYNYWFTGLNDQVLNFQQEFNYLYYTVINSAPLGTDLRTIDYREQAKRFYQPRSNESDQGQSARVNEPAANAAERLYSVGDLAKARITIVGDPAWIPQGEIWKGIGGFDSRPFLEDGSINIGAEEPLFAIAFNKPADYDLNTGVADPAGKQVGGGNSLLGQTSEASQVYVYRAITVTSTFSRGKFTQDLEGVLVFFPNQRIRYNENLEVETLFSDSTTKLENQREDIPVAEPLSTGDVRFQQVNQQVSSDLKRFESSTLPGTSDSGSADLTDYGDFSSPAEPEPTQPAEVAPATSSGQVLPAEAEFESFETQFSLLELRRANPELAREYTEYYDQQFEQLLTKNFESRKLAAENNPAFEKPLSPQALNRIEVSARNLTETQATRNALLYFRERLIPLGPAVYSDNQVTAQSSAGAQGAGLQSPIVRRSVSTNIAREF